MKEYNELLNYIDYYIYSHEKECVIIKKGILMKPAFEIYQNIISKFNLKDSKWTFDIALDCVRNMNSIDRKDIICIS